MKSSVAILGALLAVLAIQAAAQTRSPGRSASVSATEHSAHPGAGLAWREVYQSSPATTDEEQFEAFVKRSNIPADILQRIRPVRKSGTIRQRFVVSQGGSQIRLRISNETGARPLSITSMSVGIADGSAFDAITATLRPVTCGGQRTIAVPPGALMLCDPVSLPVKRGAAVLVSLEPASPLVFMNNSGEAMMVAPGDQTMAQRLSDASLACGRPIVTGISVLAPASVRTIATLGDSITDGNRSDPGVLHSWPETLARRLYQRGSGPAFSVVNAGISGNRVLNPGLTSDFGISALARLDRDVLRIEGLTHLLVLEGTNDIGMSGGNAIFGPAEVIRTEDLILGYRQIIARAHVRGVKVILGTIPPFGGSLHFSPEKERMRQEVNQWLRTAAEADGLIDFDRALRDPSDPTRLNARFDSGDHLHPSEAGSEAMGAAIDLTLFD
jgi:lysophospholipase L1-like esterase